MSYIKSEVMLPLYKFSVGDVVFYRGFFLELLGRTVTSDGCRIHRLIPIDSFDILYLPSNLKVNVAKEVLPSVFLHFDEA